MTVPTYYSDTRFVEEDDKTDPPAMAWQICKLPLLFQTSHNSTLNHTTTVVSDLFLTSTYLVFALLFSLFQESMNCKSLNSIGGLEGGPKYAMYLSLGIEHHPWANFLCFLRVLAVISF